MEASTGNAAVPNFVVTDEDRRRWDVAYGIAQSIFGEDGPRSVWQAARSIYHNPEFATGDPTPDDPSA